ARRRRRPHGLRAACQSPAGRCCSARESVVEPRRRRRGREPLRRARASLAARNVRSRGRQGGKSIETWGCGRILSRDKGGAMRISPRKPVALLVVLGCVLSAPTRVGAVPNPTVTGPIPVNATPGDPSHGYPFFSFAPQLAELKGPQHYVEEEFFFEGTANRYTIPTGVPPNSATGAILDSEHPYKTRMIVRRPNRLRDFNGTVFVEWLNVTAGYRHAE